jgi:branched-chain amino acid transport system substrate-binding protein
MKKWLYLVLAVGLLVAAVPLAGCAQPVTSEPYKVGAVLALTGSASNLGVPEKQTLEMMVGEINAKGGVNGHPLEVIIYDNETSAEKAVTLVNRLVEQDKVLAIMGPTTSGDSLAVIDAVTTAKIPLISLAASIGIVTPVEQRYWVFKTPQADKEAVTEIYKYMQTKGFARVALITNTSGFGAGGRKFLLSDAATYGISIVDDQTYSVGDTSMQSQLTHIKGTTAQAVIVWDTDQQAAIVASDMRTLQMNIPLFASHGIANKAFIQNAGAAANGVIFPAGKLLVVDEVPATDPQKQVLTKYRNDFEAKYGSGTVNTFGGHASDALNMVVLALQKLPGGLDLAQSRANIRDEIEKVKDFVGISGVFTMSPQDHLGMRPGSLAVIKIVDGKWTWAQ